MKFEKQCKVLRYTDYNNMINNVHQNFLKSGRKFRKFINMGKIDNNGVKKMHLSSKCATSDCEISALLLRFMSVYSDNPSLIV